ncbi:hypothetical protein EVJ58_g10842 [Rhodofomes roseus]|uniref:Uncharacterized protein n=1 Tax=Rhodofomes roseus TaxID=34475 RepID=A0A4Y9XKW9_9APHY|nr:hypothetical protein EVJ58_g10842 [Rhodofomes roseus]
MPSSDSRERDGTEAFVALLALGVITAAPYLLVRRRLSALDASLHRMSSKMTAKSREIVKLRNTIAALQATQMAKEAGSAALQRDVQALAAAVSMVKGNTEVMIDGMGELKKIVGDLRMKAERDEDACLRNEEAEARIQEALEDIRQVVAALQKTTEQKEQLRIEREEARYEQVMGFLQQYLHEHNRTVSSAFRDVGRSMGDVAAFMHEVELLHGYVASPGDRRGIERIRQFAKKLQELPNALPGCTTAQVRGSLKQTRGDSLRLDPPTYIARGEAALGFATA